MKNIKYIYITILCLSIALNSRIIDKDNSIKYFGQYDISDIYSFNKYYDFRDEFKLKKEYKYTKKDFSESMSRIYKVYYYNGRMKKVEELLIGVIDGNIDNSTYKDFYAKIIKTILFDSKSREILSIYRNKKIKIEYLENEKKIIYIENGRILKKTIHKYKNKNLVKSINYDENNKLINYYIYDKKKNFFKVYNIHNKIIKSGYIRIK